MKSATVITFFCAILGLGQLKPTSKQSDQEDGGSLQTRAGIADLVNPPALASNLINEGKNITEILQKPLTNVVNRTNSTANALKDVKLFFLTVQGAIVPGNAVFNLFQSIIPGSGNLAQGLSTIGNMGTILGG